MVNGNINVTNDVDYFKFKTDKAGAYDFTTIGGKSYAVYEKNSNTKVNNFHLKYYTEYYIKLSGSTGSYSVCISINQDVSNDYANIGGIWIPRSDEEYLHGDAWAVQILYLNPQEADGYYALLDSDKRREIQNEILGLSFDASVSALMSGFGFTGAVAGFIVSFLATNVVLKPLEELEKQLMKQAGGFNEQTGHFTQGIKVTKIELKNNEIPGLLYAHNYQTWDLTKIYGEQYYFGNFKNLNREEMYLYI